MILYERVTFLLLLVCVRALFHMENIWSVITIMERSFITALNGRREEKKGPLNHSKWITSPRP